MECSLREGRVETHSAPAITRAEDRERTRSLLKAVIAGS